MDTRHRSGLTVETNAKLVHSTASLTRHSATLRDHTVSAATLVGALRQQPISTLYPELTKYVASWPVGRLVSARRCGQE